MHVRNHVFSSVRLLCPYTFFFSVLVLEYCGVCFFINIILCISVICFAFRFRRIVKYLIYISILSNLIHPAGDVLWILVEPGKVVP